MINATYTKRFQKSFDKLNPDLQNEVLSQIRIFREKPFYALLENHKLHGDYKGYSSINITGDFRAVFKHIDKNTVVFAYLGTHSELYG